MRTEDFEKYLKKKIQFKIPTFELKTCSQCHCIFFNGNSCPFCSQRRR